jgi:hypothetical protein
MSVAVQRAQDRAFKTLMRNAGFVDVWRARGWLTCVIRSARMISCAATAATTLTSERSP